MTFQNIFSSIMADFRAVVWVLLCSATNKGKTNLCGCAEKANRQWAFLAFWLSSHVNIKTEAAFANWLAPKKDALFSLIYFFGSFAYITFRIIMSFRKPCHMTFRKLIPLVTLTASPGHFKRYFHRRCHVVSSEYTQDWELPLKCPSRSTISHGSNVSPLV